VGDGAHDVTLVLHGDLADSEPFATSLALSTGLHLVLTAGFTGNAHFGTRSCCMARASRPRAKAP
jgi:hypothetical protein